MGIRYGSSGVCSSDLDGGIQQVQKLVSLSGLARHLAADGLTLADALAAERSARAETSVETWIDRVTQRLYVPLEAINCLVNPGMVLIRGRLPKDLGQRLALAPHARRKERGDPMPVIAPVARAALSEEAPAVGAAHLSFGPFLLHQPGAHGQAPTHPHETT